MEQHSQSVYTDGAAQAGELGPLAGSLLIRAAAHGAMTDRQQTIEEPFSPDAGHALSVGPADVRTSALPRLSDIPTREILGLPIAMTDYAQAMDAMDGMVARRERGYVC